jgi:hypothetical protein
MATSSCPKAFRVLAKPLYFSSHSFLFLAEKSSPSALSLYPFIETCTLDILLSIIRV